MTIVLRIVFSLLVTLVGWRVTELARGVSQTSAPALTMAVAVEHAAAAVFAGQVYDVSAELLLSIAWHESRYEVATVTPEEGGKASCGVMTPEPLRSCSAASRTLWGGYLAGAAHLRGWYDACRGDERCALLGYAGGGRLIRFCIDDPEHRACQTPAVFLRRAARIASAGRPET